MPLRSHITSVRRLLGKYASKKRLAILVLAATLILFVHYVLQHPNYFRVLRHVSPWTIIWVLVLNAAMIGVLTLIYDAVLRLCNVRINAKENFLLTAYSSLANFFGPLQSGPGVRAVYLKKSHQVRLRDYTLGTLLSLGMFAFFSALFLLIGTRPWWQTLLALILVAGFSFAVVRLFIKRDKKPGESHFTLHPRVVGTLLILTFLQVCLTVGWYYVELRAVDPHIHFSQAMSYAGAANFALFVSITPDGVGIREAFLVFSQHIHHVSTADIVSANVIDRAVYIVFLGLLFILALSLHAKDRLKLSADKRQSENN